MKEKGLYILEHFRKNMYPAIIEKGRTIFTAFEIKSNKKEKLLLLFLILGSHPIISNEAGSIS